MSVPAIDHAATTSEERIWQGILKLDAAGPWTVTQLCDLPRLDDWTARSYVRRLKLAGIVAQVDEVLANKRSGARAKMLRVATPSANPPRIDRDGNLCGERVIDRLWRTMKIAGKFTVTELAALASTPEASVNRETTARYCRELAAVGVLHVYGTRTKHYALRRNIGARAPRVLRAHLVYDPNAQATIAATGPTTEVHP